MKSWTEEEIARELELADSEMISCGDGEAGEAPFDFDTLPAATPTPEELVEFNDPWKFKRLFESVLKPLTPDEQKMLERVLRKDKR